MLAACSHCGAQIITSSAPTLTGGRYCSRPECGKAQRRAAYAARASQPARQCIVCGHALPSREPGKPGRVPVTCSSACALERRHAIEREFRERAAQDPTRTRYQLSPEQKAAKQRYSNELRRTLYQANPDYRERMRASAREYYAKHGEEVNARSREWRANLTPEQQAEWRIYWRRWYINRRNRIEAAQAEQALGELHQLGAQLTQRLEDHHG